MRRLFILLIAVLVLLAVLFVRQPVELRAPELTETESDTGYTLPVEVYVALPLTWDVSPA